MPLAVLNGWMHVRKKLLMENMMAVMYLVPANGAVSGVWSTNLMKTLALLEDLAMLVLANM